MAETISQTRITLTQQLKVANPVSKAHALWKAYMLKGTETPRKQK